MCVGEASPGAGVYVAVSRARVVLLKAEEPRCLHHSLAASQQGQAGTQKILGEKEGREG